MTQTSTLQPTSFAALSALSFLILFSYAIARTVVESLFLGAYPDRTALPLAWAAVALGTTLIVAIYNRFAARLDLVRLLLISTLASAGALVALTLLYQRQVPHAAFALYLWKDIYIVILFEVLLSFANVIFRVRTARRGYGLFLFIGSLGDATGNLGLHRLLRSFSTVQLLWAPLIPFALLIPLALFLGRATGYPGPPRVERQQRSPWHDLAIVRGSAYLLWLLALIGLVQIAITLIDYDYNTLLRMSFPLDTEERTRMGNLVYSAVSVTTVVLQTSASLVLRWIGVPGTLLAVPLILAVTTAGFRLSGGFWLIAAAKVASKSLDYSLFRAAKEILYIPLSYAEKTRGKALIDMMTYRLAKGGASLLLLGLLAFSYGRQISLLTLALLGGWIALTVQISRRYRHLVSRDEER